MEKLKFALFSIVVLALIGLVGYWSIKTIQSGTEHATDQKVRQLTKENENLKKELEKQGQELGALRAQIAETAQIAEQKPEPAPPKPVVYKYQSLIDELQKLVNANVVLKQKSIGGRVGTVQKFLNLYNNAAGKVDNDYGASTVKAVAAFQSDVGLKANGEAGRDTFSKMIEWLKNQV